MSKSLFEISTLKHEDSGVSYKQAGRGEVCFFEHAGKKLVLRHYYRGGAVAFISRSGYLWSGLEKTRAYRELRLLDFIFDLDLPVCRPFAAKVCRHGFYYDAALITYHVENSVPLSELLKNRQLNEQVWFEIGRVICRFHNHNIYHSDLNASNILLDNKQSVTLIDFDKGRIVKGGAGQWKIDNLSRLQRSLEKFKSKDADFFFSNSDWEILQQGYSSGESNL